MLDLQTIKQDESIKNQEDLTVIPVVDKEKRGIIGRLLSKLRLF
jgi:hypothetical protein